MGELILPQVTGCMCVFATVLAFFFKQRLKEKEGGDGNQGGAEGGVPMQTRRLYDLPPPEEGSGGGEGARGGVATDEEGEDKSVNR